MRKAQRFLLNVFALLLLVPLGILALQNMAIKVPVQFLTWSLPDTSLGLMLAVAGLLLGGSVLLKMIDLMNQLDRQQRRAGRELERKEVSREEAEAQVKVLENKVQTLEKALNAALKSSQPR